MERNITLDYFRLFLSILVVATHMHPLFSAYLPSWLITNGISRAIVPFFFMISGYYICNKIDNNKYILKYLRHALIIYVIWSLIYLPFYYDTISLDVILSGYYQLWFMPSLITGVILLYVFKKVIKNDTLLLGIALVLFIIGYILEPIMDNPNWARNGFFLGFPFVAIGFYIQKKKIVEKTNDALLISLVCIGLFLLFAQSYLNYEVLYTSDFFIALPIYCPALFLLILKRGRYNVGHKWVSDMSSGIYFVHAIFIMTILSPLSPYSNIHKLPFAIALSILAAYIIMLLNKRVKYLL